MAQVSKFIYVFQFWKNALKYQQGFWKGTFLQLIFLCRFRGLTCIPTPESTRKLPLPKLSWADRGQVWTLMCRKDRMYARQPDYLSQHPSLQARMRAILLDWLTEVCIKNICIVIVCS